MNRILVMKELKIVARTTTLHISKEAHKFSAAHFTLFSETERERLHGHNFQVSVRLLAKLGESGFSADYNVYKRRIKSLCDDYDEYMLLPDRSPWLQISESNGNYHVVFAEKTLIFPVDETLLLPIVNVTVEELSQFLLEKLIAQTDDPDLLEIELSVSSGSGQAGSAFWRRENY